MVDCARANAAQGQAIAAEQCGYEKNVEGFLEALRKAGEAMGVEIQSLADLIVEGDRPQ